MENLLNERMSCDGSDAALDGAETGATNASRSQAASMVLVGIRGSATVSKDGADCSATKVSTSHHCQYSMTIRTIGI